MKTWHWIAIIILLTVLFSIGSYYLATKPIQSDPKEFIEKIDSLESKIDSLSSVRDSIITEIDTVYTKINNNTKEYEKNINIVVNNDVSADFSFFRNYVDSNRARLDSLYLHTGPQIR